MIMIETSVPRSQEDTDRQCGLGHNTIQLPKREQALCPHLHDNTNKKNSDPHPLLDVDGFSRHHFLIEVILKSGEVPASRPMSRNEAPHTMVVSSIQCPTTQLS